MDNRRRRIGEHAAASSLAWAVAALGAVPGDPAARAAWQQKAAAIGAYRELSGHDAPDDPIGAEPAVGSPDLRAAWHEARTALAPDDTSDIRHLTDGQLLNLPRGLPRRKIPDTAADRRPAAPGPHWRPRRRPGSATGPRRSRCCSPSRRARRSRPTGDAGRELPGHARRLPSP